GRTPAHQYPPAGPGDAQRPHRPGGLARAGRNTPGTETALRAGADHPRLPADPLPHAPPKGNGAPVGVLPTGTATLLRPARKSQRLSPGRGVPPPPRHRPRAAGSPDVAHPWNL